MKIAILFHKQEVLKCLQMEMAKDISRNQNQLKCSKAEK